jgi:hypothetical protein
MAERTSILIRIDPRVHQALVRWAADENRSTTAKSELLLREALRRADLLPVHVTAMPQRGRPPRDHGTGRLKA